MTDNLMIYFFGSDDGKLIKAGKTDKKLAQRRKGLEQGQLIPLKLHLLAAVRTSLAVNEQFYVGKNGKGGCWEEFRADVNSNETFYAVPEIVEHINWLRQQWFTWCEEDNGPDDIPDFSRWQYSPDRRLPCEPANIGVLFTDDKSSPLAETPWENLSLPEPRYNDYYTPPYLIKKARHVMGDIDLDAASNWEANRVHEIADYFHAYRSAFQNKWHGRVWVNPPYGDNKAWFSEAVRYIRSGDVEQLCFFTPLYATIGQHAYSFFNLRPAMVMFIPTPTFWGYGKDGKIVESGECQDRNGMPKKSPLGTRHSHALFYVGDNKKKFVEEFSDQGPAWSDCYFGRAV